MSPSLRHKLVLALLALFVVLGLHGAATDTPTVDEFAHLPSGAAIVKHGDFRLYANNPPLGRVAVALPALLAGARVPPAMPPGDTGWEPWLYGEQFQRLNAQRYFTLFFYGRLATLAFAVLCGLLLYSWAFRLWGDTAALAALALFVLCPNLQAHGRLATVDMASTTTLFAVFYCLDRWREQAGLARLTIVGLVFGLALLTKFTALLAAPVLLVLLVWIGYPEGWGFDGALRGLGRGLARFAWIGLVALFVVNLGYGFQGTLRPVGNYQWTSQRCQTLARQLPASFRLPLPREFLRGFDEQALDTERGEFSTYFAGTWRPRSPAVFYLVVLGLKLPLLTLGLFGAMVLAMFRGRATSALQECQIWLFPVFLLGLFSFFNALSGGIRYLLPALPFLYLGLARLFIGLDREALHRPAGACLGIALAGLLGLTLWTHPLQLGFFNSLARGEGHRWLIDSNLDWGQDLVRVPAYLEEKGLSSVGLQYFGHVEPELYGIPYRFPPQQPQSGTYIVSVNFALGYQYLAPDHGKMVLCREGAPAWLRQRTPDDRIGSSLWVYRVP